MDNIIDPQSLDHLIRKIVSERSSKRNFLPDPVNIEIVKDIISIPMNPYLKKQEIDFIIKNPNNH